MIVLALPRGGVPVAYEIANRLSLPFDLFMVRKLGAPGHEELAIGAITSDKTVVMNKEIIKMLHITQAMVDKIEQTEERIITQREKIYRGNKPFPELSGKTIILVDDGIATGYTMRAAIDVLKKKHPEGIILAVPVAARSTCDELAPLVKEIICPLRPEDFYAVGLWYDDFSQITDEEVIQMTQDKNYRD